MQRGVALEDLCNRGSFFVTELVVLEPAGWGSEVGEVSDVKMGAGTKANSC